MHWPRTLYSLRSPNLCVRTVLGIASYLVSTKSYLSSTESSPFFNRIAVCCEKRYADSGRLKPGPSNMSIITIGALSLIKQERFLPQAVWLTRTLCSASFLEPSRFLSRGARLTNSFFSGFRALAF
jgi:hypothetical protein